MKNHLKFGTREQVKSKELHIRIKAKDETPQQICFKVSQKDKTFALLFRTKETSDSKYELTVGRLTWS